MLEHHEQALSAGRPGRHQLAEPTARGALALFAEGGYHGTTTREISAAAGLSNSAVYAHFASKDELLTELVRRTHVEILRELQEAFARPADAPERLRNVVSTHEITEPKPTSKRHAGE